jgi:hypothetical protein
MDITGGQLTQTNGNPAFPGSVSTGPYIAGNVVHSDGSGTLAGVGGQSGIANQGYVEMVQFSAPISQAAASATGGVTTQIVIPAQSMIAQMLFYVTTAFTGGTTTGGVTDTASNTYSAATGVAGATIGVIGVSPPATKAIVQQWQNVGSTDVQLVFTAGGTGSGEGMLWVRYVQGCNSAQST